MTGKKAFWEAAAARQQERMRQAAQVIWEHPETGYREWQTHAFLKQEFETLGYKVKEAGNIPGFYVDIETGRPGPRVLTFGEMDALFSPGHKAAVGGVAHACGHFIQCAAVLGLAAALKEPSALEGLSGGIRIMLVPAEEALEPDFRQELREKGIIHYFSGKKEFMARGYMDDIDLAFMFHTNPVQENADFMAYTGANGFLQKSVRLIGRAAHAAAAPEKGINALQAAQLALSAMNAQRETFRDEAHIRVGTILEEGGMNVGTIPAVAKLSCSLRGARIEDMEEANEKLNRAIAAAALAMGARAEIRDELSYYPLRNDERFLQLAAECMQEACGGKLPDIRTTASKGSTDLGELCAIMPVVHPFTCCAGAANHSEEYSIVSYEKALMNPLKASLYLIEALLENGGERAKEIIEGYHPDFPSAEAYLEAGKKFDRSIDAVVYGNHSAEVRY